MPPSAVSYVHIGPETYCESFSGNHFATRRRKLRLNLKHSLSRLIAIAGHRRLKLTVECFQNSNSKCLIDMHIPPQSSAQLLNDLSWQGVVNQNQATSAELSLTGFHPASEGVPIAPHIFYVSCSSCVFEEHLHAATEEFYYGNDMYRTSYSLLQAIRMSQRNQPNGLWT